MLPPVLLGPSEQVSFSERLHVFQSRRESLTAFNNLSHYSMEALFCQCDEKKHDPSKARHYNVKLY